MKDENQANVEKLTILQAIFKSLAEQVDTKSETSLRHKVDEYFAELQEQTGARTFDLKINDELVGTYTRRKNKEKRERAENHLNINNRVSLEKWLAGVTDVELREYALDTLDDFARYKWQHDGELPYGCTVETIIIPGEAESYTGVLKVDPQLVAGALKGHLPDTVIGLLEGGNDERDY